MRKLSTCMLFTLCQLLIPISLQIYYNLIPLYLSLIAVFLYGNFYHNHLIKTSDNPYWVYKSIDIMFVSSASLLILNYGKNSLNTLLFASGVPIFYFFEKNFYDHEIIHSLLHISAISSSITLIFYLENKDIDKMDVLIILGSSYLGVLTYFSSLKFFK